MVDIDILKAQLVRQNQSEPWGFLLKGGIETGEPLTIVGLTAGSPAARIGLLVGDEIVKIGDRSTSSLTNQQCCDLVDSQPNTLLLTVERRAEASSTAVYETAIAYRQVAPNAFSVQQQQQQQQPIRSYQPVDMTGSNRYPSSHTQKVEYHTVQSRPFDSVRQTTATTQYTTGSSGNYEPDHSDFYLYSQYDNGPTNYPTSNSIPRRFVSDEEPQCAQSRSFRILQTVMHNEEPAAGVSGLPPPRSAAMEHLRRQQQGSGFAAAQDDAPRRVKVFMPQQYNSPMGMYSAHNVLETFTVQAENMLDSLERRRLQDEGDEFGPVYSTN